MKAIIALCSVVFFASCVGADEDGLRSSTEERKESVLFTPSMCLKLESSVIKKVTEVGNKCIKMAVTRELQDGPPTLEEFRDFFKEFCPKQSLVRSCLAETTVNMEVCRNETFLNTFKVYRDIIETILSFGCNEDGEPLATLWYELVTFFTGNRHNMEHFTECFDIIKIIFDEVDKSQIDFSSKLYNTHKGIGVFTECIYQQELVPSLKDHLKTFVDLVINTMKCIHPQDGTLVPCATIDASLISVKNICDLKTVGTEMSLYDILEEDSGACTTGFLRYSDEDADDNAKIRAIVEDGCHYRAAIPYCYNMSRIMSELCLNETQQTELNLYGDFIKDASEEACFEDGRRLSEIAYEVYRLQRSGQGHAVYDCIDVALSTRNVTDVHSSSSKNMRFYHELEAFKGCLVDKLQGDQTSVVAATSLIDELLKKVKCVHPEEGTTVLCETLHTKV